MNLLAHAYLSFGDADVLVGNMISDHVKGKDQFNFPEQIRRGIKLHREIDTYTDEHPATRELKSYFKPTYRLYAAPISDIVYDHFLATDVNEFSTGETLFRFSIETYSQLEKMKPWFPAGFQQIFPYMQQYNWLYNYRFNEGISKSIQSLVRRAKFISEYEDAVNIFLENKAAMRTCYEDFFPSLKKHALEVLANLKK